MSGTSSNNIARFTDSFEGRNRLINGACSVVQRIPLAYTTGITGFGGPDRWVSANGAANGQFTQSQGDITYNGVEKPAVLQTVNTAPTSMTGTNYWVGIAQKIEGFNCFDLVGQQITISFIFNTNVSGIYSIALIDSVLAYSYLNTFTAVANVPARYTFTLPAIPAGATVPQTNGVGLSLYIGGLNFGSWESSTTGQWLSGEIFCYSGATNWSATAGNFISVTDVQLEQGIMATTFERRQYGLELFQCQRYYQVFENTLYAFFSNGSYGGGTNQISGVGMRATPTLIAGNYNGAGGYTGGVNGGTLGASVNSFYVSFITNATIGQFCAFILECSAEL